MTEPSKYHRALKAFIRRYAELYPEFDRAPEKLADGSVAIGGMPQQLADQLFYEACEETDVDPDEYDEVLKENSEFASLQSALINHVVMGAGHAAESGGAARHAVDFASMLPDGTEPPYDARAYFERAIVLMRMHMLEPARSNFVRAAELEPDDYQLLAGSFFYKGCIEADLNNVADAIKDVEHALSICKEHDDNELSDSAQKLLADLHKRL